MRLHIEGKDASKLMNLINGMGTLRITDDEFHVVDCVPRMKVWDYVRYEEHERRKGIIEIKKVEWKEFDYIWPNRESLYCAMQAAMRGMGWSGRYTGHNSITVPEFLTILHRHADENGFNIRYIETA